MKLTTSLALIRAHFPCKSGWSKLLDSLGGAEAYGENTPINLLTILKSNGVADMLWCLRATHQDSKKISAQLAVKFADEVLPIFEERRPDDLRYSNVIQAARDFNCRLISLKKLREVQYASLAAAKTDTVAAAAVAAADAAAAAATDDAVDAFVAAEASSLAANAAAYARNNKMREKQAEIIRKYLSED